MKKNPKISIIIPVYNAENYLEKCVQSILDQTYKNLEIILVDDCSKDSSAKICMQLEKKDERIHFIKKDKNSGQAATRNIGLKNATGDFITFVDNDDTIEKNMYKILINDALKYKLKVVGCGTNMVFDTYSVDKYKGKSSGVLDFYDIIYNILYLNDYEWGTVWNKLFSSDIKEDLYFLENNEYEDYYVIIKLCLKYKKFYFNNLPLYNWYQRKNSQSKRGYHKGLKSFSNVCLEIKKLFANTDNESKFVDGLHYFEFVLRTKMVLMMYKNKQISKKEIIDEIQRVKELKSIVFRIKSKYKSKKIYILYLLNMIIKFGLQFKKEKKMKYDYLIVGAGLYGATFAYEMSKKGKRCLVIDRRDHIGGNIYCEEVNGIGVHKYGAHIFHTSNKDVWDYVNQFVEFNNYVNCPVANYKGELYNLPFNMNTFTKLWNDVITPSDAMEKIEEQKKELNGKEPSNLEEQAISLVGRDIYEKLVKGYTEKQWGRDCKNLPAFIIKRLPVRFTFNNNYFNDRYQGIPIGGYNKIIEKMLENCDVELNVDYLKDKQKYDSIAEKILYTGMIDEYFNYSLGNLDYRSLRFETEILSDNDNYQGNAVINYTEREIPYTRIIEHKHFEFNDCKGTVITKEYPSEWKIGDEAYYPVNDEKNIELFNKYKELASMESNVIFGGRLGNYKYYDMDKVIEAALDCVKKEGELE